VGAGWDTMGEKLIEQEVEVERQGTGAITQIDFDEPVLISAGEMYHMAQSHTTTHVSGCGCSG